MQPEILPMLANIFSGIRRNLVRSHLPIGCQDRENRKKGKAVKQIQRILRMISIRTLDLLESLRPPPACVVDKALHGRAVTFDSGLEDTFSSHCQYTKNPCTLVYYERKRRLPSSKRLDIVEWPRRQTPLRFTIGRMDRGNTLLD